MSPAATSSLPAACDISRRRMSLAVVLANLACGLLLAMAGFAETIIPTDFRAK
jgi:hypothetical protein